VYTVFMKIYYNPKLKKIAKKLRKNSTLSEILLWRHLKNKKMSGFDFHRQKPIDEYVVDFFCAELNLIIEIDGDSHDFEGQQDEIRGRRLEFLGFFLLRYEDKDVKKDLENVLVSINSFISSRTR
jgi:very-short-patch-repair endonuclease